MTRKHKVEDAEIVPLVNTLNLVTNKTFLILRDELGYFQITRTTPEGVLYDTAVGRASLTLFKLKQTLKEWIKTPDKIYPEERFKTFAQLRREKQ